MASVAEAIAGAGKGKFSTYFITISTGIGGSLFENGLIKNASSEIGHTLVPYKGEYYELEKNCEWPWNNQIITIKWTSP